MNDMESSELNTLSQQALLHNIYISVIGIGIDFNTELTETMIKNEGCNYFCITKDEEMLETVVKNFHYNFMVVALGLNLQVFSDDFEIERIYGTPFDEQFLEGGDAAKQYGKDNNIDVGEKKWTVISEINAVTASNVENGRQQGGLILVQLKPKDVVKGYKGKVGF